MQFLILLLFPLLLFFLFLTVFIPFKFTITSIITLLRAPKQIVKVASDRQLRRNHALEHATINILESDYGYNNLSGWAKKDGFYVRGNIEIPDINQAAQEGLLRLRQGEKNLVIHKSCGTSLLTANLLAAVIFLFLIFKTASLSLFNVLIALVLANFLGPFFGVWIQKKFTTAVDVTGMEIVNVYYKTESTFLFNSKEVFVKTDQLEVY